MRTPDVVPAWKKELNERLAATRTRRLRKQEEQVALPGLEHMKRKVDSRASMLAAKVAQRYANAPSYSDVLAAEARARGRGSSDRRRRPAMTLISRRNPRLKAGAVLCER